MLTVFPRIPRARSLALGALVAAAFTQAPSALAVDSPGTDPTAAIRSFANLTPNFSVSNTTYGYEFTTQGSIAISSIGIYDSGANGLAGAHDVGIWSLGNTSTPLATIQVPSGTTAALVNGFRYQNLANLLVLQSGTYRIGALIPAGSNDAFLEDFTGGGSATTGLGVSLGGSYYSLQPSPNLAYPNLPTGLAPGYFGPNFQYTNVPGPLPLLGAATAFGYSRRLRRRVRRSSSVN